jgi:hypothetical protein
LNIAGAAGGVAVANQTAANHCSLYKYNMCNNVDLALKAMILLKAVPRIYYLAQITDPTYKFANVLTAQMLTHLVTTYGTINKDNLATILENCEAAWDPNTPPIESIIANMNYVPSLLMREKTDANKVPLTLKVVKKGQKSWRMLEQRAQKDSCQPHLH